MPQPKAIDRRKFLSIAIACSSSAGCLETSVEQQGAIDQSDITIPTQNSTEITAKNATKDGNSGLEISTNDSVTDGEVIAEIPVSVSNVSKSTIYAEIDVDKMDDDAEVEIRFQSGESGFRSVYIGNEYKNKEKGVIATKTGSGHRLEIPFQKLPSSANGQTGQISVLNQIQLVIRDGDFQCTIWDLRFIFEDKTIAIL
ncbi:hypothetical protein [Halorussus aquaticus]|uniref:Lipoprotein n=1 Tax=Halorussus aquaticus TaxID=2953748 RepID=A0ABD5Q1J6_9EURY|nr:hypothetical protein [Halorussus aquaticus]